MSIKINVILIKEFDINKGLQNITLSAHFLHNFQVV